MDPGDLTKIALIIFVVAVIIVMLIIYFPIIKEKIVESTADASEIVKEEWGITEKEQYKEGIKKVSDDFSAFIDGCFSSQKENCLCKKEELGKLPEDTAILIYNEDSTSWFAVIDAKTQSYETEQKSFQGNIGALAIGEDNKLYCYFYGNQKGMQISSEGWTGLEEAKGIKQSGYVCLILDGTIKRISKVQADKEGLLKREEISGKICAGFLGGAFGATFLGGQQKCIQGIIDGFKSCE
ncbi:hypothetical protein HZB88_01620 [archaeon]|nr:hypothetical protein [archaeon]